MVIIMIYFICTSSSYTRLFELGTDPYVLPRQCEQVFYSEVPGKAGWSFVVRHNPRGRPVKYDASNEEGSLEEEDDDEEHDQHELADDDNPTKDVQEIVESNDVANNVDEDYTDDDRMSVSDDDDDDDMANLYNVDSRYVDANDELDEEDVDMDEEDNEIY